MSNIVAEKPVPASQLKVKKQVGAVELSVEVLIFLLYKAFSAMRTYTPDHPLFQNTLLNLNKTFDEFFEVYDQLDIRLTESEIVFQGESIYREEDKRSSLIFMLFNDGIREIRFEKGLTYQEIRGFLEALKINAGLPQTERDIVSLFWARDFDHIHYYAIDEIPDQEIESVEHALSDFDSQKSVFDSQDETDAVLERRSGIEECLSDFDLKEQRLNSMILSRLKAFKDEEIEDLLGVLKHGKCFNAEEELVAIIFDVLRLEDDEDRYMPVFKLMEEYSDELLTKCVYAPLNVIIKQLSKFSEEHERSFPSKARFAEVLLRGFSEGEKMNLFRFGLKAQLPCESHDLCTFVAELRPTAIGSICFLLEEIKSSKIRATICQGLETLAREQAPRLIRPIENASETVARQLVSVLGKTGDENGPELLQTFRKHNLKGVREETILALKHIANEKAQKVLIDFLTDKDHEVRALAAESLESISDGHNIEPLLDVIRRKTFHARRFREKKALLSILGSVGSQQCVQILEAFMKKKFVIHRKRHSETRICAALALGPHYSDITYHLLNKYSHDSSYLIKSACMTALQEAQQ
ncbi:MAG: HEAT repeat domain-containing protein [Gemmatimonadota bacterium]|nr:MAG: HEAT repeat domain-containing protein [Gemmatimonadota bacterium]